MLLEEAVTSHGAAGDQLRTERQRGGQPKLLHPELYSEGVNRKLKYVVFHGINLVYAHKQEQLQLRNHLKSLLKSGVRAAARSAVKVPNQPFG